MFATIFLFFCQIITKEHLRKAKIYGMIIVCKKEEDDDTTDNRFADSFANFKHCAFNCFLYEIILRRVLNGHRKHRFACCFGAFVDSLSCYDDEKK